MPRRRRATLRSKWWIDQFALIRNCYACGAKLNRRYVKEEKVRRHVCTQCGRITYLNPKVVAGLIPVMPDGRVVLLRRSIEPAIGRWTYPAGFQEMAETVEEAARREAQEEASIDVEVGSLVGLYSYADAGVVTIVYEGKVKRGERPRIGPEAEEVALFKWEEIPWKDLAFRSTVEALRDWRKKNRRLKK
jgi:ADP-ribose pyrophosphatase YjhB (NUDIX family)